MGCLVVSDGSSPTSRMEKEMAIHNGPPPIEGTQSDSSNHNTGIQRGRVVHLENENITNSRLLQGEMKNLGIENTVGNAVILLQEGGGIGPLPKVLNSGVHSDSMGQKCFILDLIGLLVLCLCIFRRGAPDQRGRGVSPAPAGEESGSPSAAGVSIDYTNLGETFTHEELQKATGEFSDLNLIKHGHPGELFQGVLENGYPVVMKKIDVHLAKKDPHMVEIELFSRASHTRLVPFLGHCLDHEHEKLLVYKYMSNGDLTNSLYRNMKKEDGTMQSLDWITRLKIAIGAAEGLSFLHHECSPPIVQQVESMVQSQKGIMTKHY
ncbi:hypothetical protein MKX01_023681 [Papaver californicum]|nr:hypothetical protein MKX01_023681 [Papaver californicum]